MIGERLQDRYEVIDELGRGGMGVVYRARDELLDREVAVKILFGTELTPDHADRFIREARLVAQLDHPAIVPIFDFGRCGEAPYFVMPVVAGEGLDQWIRDRSLRLGEALEIVAQVAEGLDHSHGRGVVHRDVKPSNVMVTREDDRPRARLLDFGLALGSPVTRLTRTGKLPGTLHYLSPEQIVAERADSRSDVYSLGAVLFECLIGEPPFSGTHYTLLYRIAHQPPPSLVTQGVDPELAEIVLGCLAKEPDQRPQPARELARALRRYLRSVTDGGGVPVPGPRPAAAEPEAVPAALESDEVPLCGRAEESAELHRRLNEALTGECQLALIGGETGMGKTRLLEELGKLARVRGIRVLRSRFTQEESAFPYQGFCELIQDYLRSRESSSAASGVADLGDLVPELVELFPILAETFDVDLTAAGESGAAGGQRSGERRYVFEVLARTLARLAGGEPVVFFFEGLHGAEAAIEALLYIFRRLGPTPTLIVGTYQPAATPRGHPLRRLLASLKDDPRCISLHLEALPPEAHRELVTALIERSAPSGAGGAAVELGPELAERLHEATEGNPFFTRELLRSLVESGGLVADQAGVWNLSGESVLETEALPETIRQIVERRLERLAPEQVEILTLAAVLGKGFEFADLAALAATGLVGPQRPENEVDEAVDGLIREGLLAEDRRTRGDRLHFVGAVVRDVLYGRLTRRRRRRLHRRHAEHLEKRYAGRTESVAARLLHHYAAGDAAAKAVEYSLRLARKSLAAWSAEDTIRAARTGLEFVDGDELEGEAVEGELRRLLAAAWRLTGAFDAGLAELGQAVPVFEQSGETRLAAAAALEAAETAWQGRKVTATRRWVDKGISLARASGDQESLRKLLTLGATVANLRGEYGQAKRLLAEAADLTGTLSRLTAPAAIGGTLRTALPNPVAILDPEAFGPRNIATTEDLEVLANVFETLLRSDADGHLIPGLARQWEGSKAGDAFRFTLRSDVCFSDGRPLVAADVKRSFELPAPRGPGPAPADLAIAGMAEFLAGEADEVRGIRVYDDRVIEFQLTAPLALFPALVTDLRTAVVREDGGRVLGTGPFRLAGHGPDRIALERNPHHWRPTLVPLETIEFRTGLDAHGIAAGLRSGELDVGRDLRPEDLEELLLHDAGLRSGLAEAIRSDVFFVLFNGNRPVTGDPRVRAALTGVVRVQEIVWRTLGRFAQPAVGWIPPGMLGHDPGRRPGLLARERAAELLREAGRTPPIRLRAAIHPLLRDRYGALTRALFEDWAALGVEVVPGEPGAGESEVEWFLARIQDAGDVDLWIGRWEPDYRDPDLLTHGLLHSRHGEFSDYVAASPTDELMERARREASASVRQGLYRQIENRLLADHVVLPLFHEVDYRISGPRIRGLRLLPEPPYVNYAEISKVTPAAPAPAEPRQGAVYVALPMVFDRVDPLLGFRVEPTEVLPNVFESLTRIDEGAHVVPWLAARFRVEDDARRFRVWLRDDVRFHDGRRLTARDVRYSFERLLRALRPGAEALYPLVGAGAFRDGRTEEIAGLVIESPHEVVFALDSSMPQFAARLAHPTTAIVPEGTQNFAGSWREGCVGTGPFRLAGLEPDRWIELEAHPAYWRRGYPRCERLIFELGVQPERVVSDFRAGRLSLAAHLRPADLEALRQDATYAAGYCEAPGLSTYYLMFNVHTGPLAEGHLRRTLVAALDVAGPLRSIGRLGVPASGIIPPGLLGAAAKERPAAEPAAVSDLAGVELKASVHPVFRALYSPFWERLCRSFEELGVRLKVTYQTTTNLLSPQVCELADVVATRWYADCPDSDSFVGLFDSEVGLDGAYFGNAELDRLIIRGRLEPDPALRNAIYREFEQTLAREALLVPLFHEQVYRFARPEVRGLKLGFWCPEVAYEELSLEE